MPVSDVDRWLGERRRIVAAWPFATTSSLPQLPQPATEGERTRGRLRAAHDVAGCAGPVAALRAVGRRPAEYVRISAILADAFPFEAGIQFETAAVMIAVSRPADALAMPGARWSSSPECQQPAASAHALILGGRRDEGRATLERVLDRSGQPDGAQRARTAWAASPQESPP
jgi:hypothetical protein